MPKDVYVRLTPQGPRPFGIAEPYRSLVFVDLHHDDIDELRKVPQGVIDHPAAVLVRCEAPSQHPHAADGCPGHRPTLEDLESIARRLRLTCPIGLLCQSIGSEAVLEAVNGGLHDPDEFLARARAVELRALLDWGNAVWRPKDYHYRLPSGEHAAAFVRVADAIRQPRDAHVLASWLRPHLRDGLAIVCDSGTISAVIESVKADALAAEMTLARTAVLEQYPASPLDVSQAVQHVIGEASAVLGLLSVNASGQVAAWLRQALYLTGGAIEDWALEIMVDRELIELEHVQSWLPLASEAEGERLLDRRRSRGGATCELCNDPKTARLIPISPISFDGMMPGQVRQLMPSIRDAQQNARYWEQCSVAEAIGLIEKPDEAVKNFRPSPEHMPIHFRQGKLLEEASFHRQAAQQVQALIEKQKETPESELAPEHRLSGEADLVLVPEHERNRDGYDELWGEVGPVIASDGVDCFPFPVDGEWSTELLERVGEASDILVFALGLVTGGSLTRALTNVQIKRKELDNERDFTIRGLVMHARPERLREWESLENSYAESLFAVCLSLITNREPLREEENVLESIDASLMEEPTAAFHGARKAFCAGDGREPLGMFWGGREDDRLSPHSLFGEGLNGITTWLAVGSAMERARQVAQENTAPEMRVFELSALTKSYYDPMILSAVFRWLLPEEAWWGERPEEAQAIAEWMLGRADAKPGQLRILVPELLLATAQGKVPDRAAEVIERKAEAMLARIGDGEARAPLELGLRAARTRELKWPVLSPEFETG